MMSQSLSIYLLLGAIDLLNKQCITVEEHERVLHTLVSDRNAPIAVGTAAYGRRRNREGSNA